jgi:hypothetical protein
MTGMLCNAKCVKQDSGKAACDSGCTAKSSDVVFIDDQGKATKVAGMRGVRRDIGLTGFQPRRNLASRIL